MEMRKLKADKVPGEAERRRHCVKSNEASTTARTDNSWQEEAAIFLLRSGFRPGDAMGQVQHVAIHIGRPAPVLIACSAWDDAQTRRRTADLGFAAHLCKPVTLEALETALALACEQANSDRASRS